MQRDVNRAVQLRRCVGGLVTIQNDVVVMIAIRIDEFIERTGDRRDGRRCGVAFAPHAHGKMI